MAVFPSEIRASLGHCVSRAFGILTGKLHTQKEHVENTRFCYAQCTQPLGKNAGDDLISLSAQIPPGKYILTSLGVGSPP